MGVESGLGGGRGFGESWGTFSPSSGPGKGNAQFRETWGQKGRERRRFGNSAAVVGRRQRQQQGAAPLGVEAQAAQVQALQRHGAGNPRSGVFGDNNQTIGGV